MFHYQLSSTLTSKVRRRRVLSVRRPRPELRVPLEDVTPIQRRRVAERCGAGSVDDLAIIRDLKVCRLGPALGVDVKLPHGGLWHGLVGDVGRVLLVVEREPPAQLVYLPRGLGVPHRVLDEPIRDVGGLEDGAVRARLLVREVLGQVQDEELRVFWRLRAGLATRWLGMNLRIPGVWSPASVS